MEGCTSVPQKVDNTIQELDYRRESSDSEIEVCTNKTDEVTVFERYKEGDEFVLVTESYILDTSHNKDYGHKVGMDVLSRAVQFILGK